MDSDQHNKAIECKRSHVEFTCTEEQKKRLERELKATGVVVDIKINDLEKSNSASKCDSPPLEGMFY